MSKKDKFKLKKKHVTTTYKVNCYFNEGYLEAFWKQVTKFDPKVKDPMLEPIDPLNFKDLDKHLSKHIKETPIITKKLTDVESGLLVLRSDIIPKTSDWNSMDIIEMATCL
jgi:hypothetical protein